MTLQVKKRDMVHNLTNRSIADGSANFAHLVNIIGGNGPMRAGIATELDIGLDKVKHVLIPVYGDVVEKDLAPVSLHGGAPFLHRNKRMVHNITNAWAEEICQAVAAHRTWRASNDQEYREYEQASIRYQLAKDKPQDQQNEDERNIVAAGAPDDPAPSRYVRDVTLSDNITDHNVFADDPAYCTDMFALTVMLNYEQLREDYNGVNLRDGQFFVAAHAIASAWRMGVLETGLTREFVQVAVTQADTGDFRIAALESTYDAREHKHWKLNDVIPYASLRIDQALLELGTGCVIAAGYNHYTLNHTTGGSGLTGPLAAMLALNGLFVPEIHAASGSLLELARSADKPSVESQTALFYNALHPINKRAIAQMHIRNSHVYSYTSSLLFPNLTTVEKDTFLKLRETAAPAGSHKVFVAALALANIADAGWAIFLPWWGQIATIRGLVSTLARTGARAHPGSFYYTDEPSNFSQSDADAFLPDLAYYCQKRMAASTITRSPHMSAHIADLANPAWKNFVDSIVSKPIAPFSGEQLTSYARQVGDVGIVIDPADPSTFGAAIAQQRDLAAALRQTSFNTGA